MPVLQTMFQPTMDVDRIDAEENRFKLRATGGGFLAKLLGLGSRAVVTADAHGFRLQKTTFGTDENTYVPRSKIASTVCVVTKPLEYLLLGLLTLPLFGLGLVFLIYFFFAKRRAIIGVVSSGGTVEAVKLKASKTSLDDVREGVKILEKLVRDDPAHEPQGSGAARPASSPTPARAAGDTGIITCPGCGARMSLPASSAGRKVRCASCREVFVAAPGE